MLRGLWLKPEPPFLFCYLWFSTFDMNLNLDLDNNNNKKADALSPKPTRLFQGKKMVLSKLRMKLAAGEHFSTSC